MPSEYLVHPGHTKPQELLSYSQTSLEEKTEGGNKQTQTVQALQ